MDKLLSGRRILVVEDEMLVLMMAEDMLADLGCLSVSVASTVAKALALINADAFDAAILDMNLTGEKSFPVADALAIRRIPFAFATGYSGQDMREGHRDRPLLKKPYRLQELERVLRRILAADVGANAVGSR